MFSHYPTGYGERENDLPYDERQLLVLDDDGNPNHQEEVVVDMSEALREWIRKHQQGEEH